MLVITDKFNYFPSFISSSTDNNSDTIVIHTLALTMEKHMLCIIIVGSPQQRVMVFDSDQLQMRIFCF